MISRDQTGLLALLLIAVLAVNPFTATDEFSDETTEEGGCDQTHFFMCASDGACISRTWLADGEQDCADGTDESDEIFEALQKPRPSTSGTSGRKKSKTAPPIDRDLASESDAAESDIFSPAPAADATRRPPPSFTLNNGESSESCSKAQVVEAAKCAIDILSWLDELEQNVGATPAALSIFRNESTLSRVERGCALLPAYLSCVDALPTTCERPAASRLADWLAIETYLCELLTPSLREHYSCFGASAACRARHSAPDRNRLVCTLVGEAADDVDCVERAEDASCDERARELFAPLRAEAENFIEELKCSATVVKKSSSTTTTTSRPTARSTTVFTTTETPTTVAIVAAENELATRSESHNVRPSPKEPKSLVTGNALNLTSALFSLSHLDAVCALRTSASGDLWAPIRVKLCSNRAAFAKHAECYAKVHAETEQKCASEPLEREITCGAINTFNRNVDCVIGALTDACATDAQELLINVQNRLNDEAIAHKCFEALDRSAAAAPPDGFALTPKLARCKEIQENKAVTCLVELIEINRQLAQFASLNFLGELANANSTLVGRICGIYERYEYCLNTNVFKNATAKTCAFNSPLNTLARIGLSPICAPETRRLITGSADCIQDAARQIDASNCQNGLQRLSGTVEMMLHGVHGEALLCKSFYVMRHSFECAEAAIRDRCDAADLANIQRVRQAMSDIGVEEGCPVEEPFDLDEIIARPMGALPTTPAPTGTSPCAPEPLHRFNECIRPLINFKPHPLAVIKAPKDIEAACRAYDEYRRCRNTDECDPAWARGMSAMFEYACGEGAKLYAKVKMCLRKTTTQISIRPCVGEFSRSPPRDACRSANQLLACAQPHIADKCGEETVSFAREYVRRFVNTVDTDCRLADNFPVAVVPVAGDAPVASTFPRNLSPVRVLNCSADEAATAERCARPLADVHAELEWLFQGGFQAFIHNVNNVAPIFARGCNLTNEFRQCARPVLERAETNVSQCVLSSCFMRAGDDICNQANVAEAIDSNLQCVFKQVAVPEFGVCIRSTIATLRHFTLEALRDVLPAFVDCAEPIVLRACGSVPLNVLRALGSRDVCAIRSRSATDALTPSLTIVPTSADEHCTPELAHDYTECMRPFLAKYTFAPIALLNRANESTLCSDLDTVTQCIDKNRICEEPGNGRAVRKLITQICSNKHAFDQRAECLAKIVTSSKGAECLAGYDAAKMAENADGAVCSALNATTECMAERVFEECPPDSVPFVYDYTNAFWRDLVSDQSTACELIAPTVALQTGCPEEKFIDYLKCESHIDKYHFQPISIIRDPSMWEKFCMTVENEYKPCLKSLLCKFEPAMSSALSLYETTCDELSPTGKMQASIVGCLGEFTKSKRGEECLKPFAGLDLIGRDASERICTVVDELIACAAPSLNENCGADTLEHVYALHETWTRGFNKTCNLRRPTAEELAVVVESTSGTTTKAQTPSKRVDPTTTAHADVLVNHNDANISTTEIIDIQSSSMSTASPSAAINKKIIAGGETKRKESVEEKNEIDETTTTTVSETMTTIVTSTTTKEAGATSTMTDVSPKMRTPTGNGAIRGSFSCLLSTALLVLTFFIGLQ